MKRVYAVLITLLVILFVAFIIQNAEMVDFTFLIWGIEISKALLMILCAAIGFFLGILVFSFNRRRHSEKEEPVKEPTSHTPSSH